jgi:hypothetical protein
MKLIYSIVLLFSFQLGAAREGMWLPQLLGELNEKEMRAMGMQITAEDIYSINQSSLKDAVIQFGGGCTGALISSHGLLLTNYHCGFSQIQSLSTMEKNYLEGGFWAQSYEEELPCPGLTATFIRGIRDVTVSVLAGVPDTLEEQRRNTIIHERADSLEKNVSAGLKGVVRSFYHGNKYYLFLTEVFSDIRFVGAPPQAIGKFGGETDNWMWPRHTGDFALYRIYANKENRPVPFSVDNVPYTPGRFLKLNRNGVREGDFVFIYGFPGRTNEYLLSPGLELIQEQTNPNRIEIRGRRLEIIREAMNRNDTIRLQYSSKFSTIENSYKKWMGEMEGFTRFDAINRKKSFEASFFSRLRQQPSLAGDTMLVDDYTRILRQAKPVFYANDFYAEAFPGVEILSVSLRLNSLLDACRDTGKSNKDVAEMAKKLRGELMGFYKNYNAEVDRQQCAALFRLAYAKLESQFLPVSIVQAGKMDSGFVSFSKSIYAKALFADSARLSHFLSRFSRRDVRQIRNDPAYVLATALGEIRSGIQQQLSGINRELGTLQRNYMKDILALDTTGLIYPDANSTLRVSYGKVESMDPRDGVRYDFRTTAAGIREKFLTGNPDYTIPPRLEELIRKKDFGDYATGGVLPVAFLASNHTTGGNSGSPCLNAHGELVGINFDRVWEGVLSDYLYDGKYCRNITVDIRYILFLIDKFGNAKRLLEELELAGH